MFHPRPRSTRTSRSSVRMRIHTADQAVRRPCHQRFLHVVARSDATRSEMIAVSHYPLPGLGTVLRRAPIKAWRVTAANTIVPPTTVQKAGTSPTTSQAQTGESTTSV